MFVPSLVPWRAIRAFVLAIACMPAVCISSGVEAEEDRTDTLLNKTSSNCADYVGSYTASARDEGASKLFISKVEVSSAKDSCSVVSNNIPNHNFNDSSAHFAHQVQEVKRTFTIPRNPQIASQATALTQHTYNAVMLNGVPLDILSAGCYKPNGRGADNDGNVAIGCSASSAWLLDPLGANNTFGTDAHNAHTQPDGSYHYHGDPMALFEGGSSAQRSPVIGFAAECFSGTPHASFQKAAMRIGGNGKPPINARPAQRRRSSDRKIPPPKS